MVVLRDIDEVHRIAADNLDDRRQELPQAWAIVRSEAERFYAWRASLHAEPIVTALRRRAEAIRVLEVERAMAESPGHERIEFEQIDAITCSLVNKLLEDATSRIRYAAATGSGRAQLSAIQELLHLPSRQEAHADGRHARLAVVEPREDDTEVLDDASPQRQPTRPAA
jgi:glutamyl-tRNA reductase